MKAAEWQKLGTMTGHRGYNVFHRIDGGGFPLLLLHGFPTASYDWFKIWQPLAVKYRLIAPDFIGYGFSDKPKEYNYTVFDHADQVETLLALHNVKSYGILAHDYGDTVAQEIMARSLERNDKLLRFVCMLNGGLFPETHRPRPIQKLLLGPLGFLVSRLVNEKSFKKSFLEIFGADTKPGDEELTQYWKLVEANSGSRIYHKLIRYILERRANRERWVGAVARAEVPVRIINGLDDPVSGAHFVARYRELIPKPDVVELRGIGHYPHSESPEAVLKAFLAFAGPLSER